MIFPEWLVSIAGEALFLALSISDKAAFPKPLTTDEERTLIAKGDRESREKLIEHNLRLVAHIAKKYSGRDAEQEELVSIGAIGLIKAVNTFDPKAGRLSPYASRCIENEILMFLRAGKKTRGNVSLDEPIGSDSEGNDLRLTDLLGSDADLVSRDAEINIESRRAVEMMKGVLDLRERQVIALRYGLIDDTPRAQRDVALMMGISRSYVSRIEKNALEKLRAAMNKT